jgi:hypothetical protein
MMLNDKSLGILQVSKIFKGLSDDQIKMLSDYIGLLRFNNNDIKIEEGQTGHPLLPASFNPRTNDRVYFPMSAVLICQ